MDTLIAKVLECGADGACILPADRIVLSGEFRRICENNQCGAFGRCWMCPPDIGEIGELMDTVRSFPQGLMYQTIGKLEDSFDVEGMFEAASRHALLGQAVQAALAPMLKAPFLHLSCGGCHLCQRCAKQEGLPCRFPDKALPAMEGYGVDVYRSVEKTHLKYTNGPNTVTYFGMILFHE